MSQIKLRLWFDVGIKRYTTTWIIGFQNSSCGLMQESKDIQRRGQRFSHIWGCGLMQESKDIQHNANAFYNDAGCGLMQESKDIQR